MLVQVAEPLKLAGESDWVEPYVACDFMIRQISAFLVSCQGKTWSERMKTKNFYAVMLFSLAMVTTFWILVDPSPNLHTIVSETHKQISNIRNIPSNIRNTKKELLEVDKRYLKILGFPTSTAPVKANYTEAEVLATDPVVVVPVLPSTFEQSQLFLSWTYKLFPDKLVVFFDLGLGGRELLQVSETKQFFRLDCVLFRIYINFVPICVKIHSFSGFLIFCDFKSLVLSQGKTCTHTMNIVILLQLVTLIKHLDCM